MVPADVATLQARIEPWIATARSALTRDRSGKPDAATRLVVGTLVGSRLVVWLAGLGALAIFGRDMATFRGADPNGASAPFFSHAANFLAAPAARWDSVWYLVIAHSGYYSFQSSGMFPLYPVLIRAGTIFFHSELIVGLAISVASMAFGMYLLHRLVALDFGDRVAGTTVLLMAFFPASLFFSAVYTESLFLLLSVGAVYAARRDRWAWAGLLGCLASATKSSGVALVVPLALMFLYGPRTAAPDRPEGRWWQPRYRLSRPVAWIGLVPGGLVAFLAYLGFAHGQPLATFHAQTVFWGHQFAGPFGAVVRAVAALPHDVSSVIAGSARPVGVGDPVSWNAHELIDFGFLAFAVVGLAGAWRRVPIAYLAYAVAVLLEPLSVPTSFEPLQSLSRYVLTVFPLFIGWALILERRRAARLAALGVSTAALVGFSALWAMWAWVA